MRQLSLFDKTIEIPLTRGYVAIVSCEDADLAGRKWYVRVNRIGMAYVYRSIKIKEKFRHVAMHRIILSRILERPLDEHEFVDHINHNPLDNRRCNLRLATKVENNQNSRKRRDNTSGFKGVYWNKWSKKWGAQIYTNGRHIHLGYFSTPEIAHEAYKKAAEQYHGEFSCFE
jgi:hypothetical protein